MKSFFRFLFSLRTIVFLLLTVAVLGGGAWGGWYWYTSATKPPTYRTSPVVRSNLTAVINATGTIEPEEVIDVGAQVAGQIMTFGVDPTDPSKKRPIDYGTKVDGPDSEHQRDGTTLAELDKSVYQARLNSVRALLEKDQADLKRLQALKDQTARLVQRDLQLQGTEGAIAGSDLDLDKANAESAAAAVNVGRASIDADKANLEEAQKNLGYCTIKSPVNGVIIDRRVNVGQTVVAGLSAPSLFLIAKDLMKLQVWASVNEADIGNIFVDQEVTFTVDARPNKVYTGKVKQIRLNATMTQNVVTYTVVVSTDNKILAADDPARKHVLVVSTPSGQTVSSDTQNLELLPYLTANLQFKVDERKDALQVPNAALRWRPQQPSQVAPEFQAVYEQGQRSRAKPAAADEAKSEEPTDKDKTPKTKATVWVEDGTGFVRPVRIVTGLTDGIMTEVVEVLPSKVGKPIDFDEKTQVVTAEATGGRAQGVTNPFTPQLGGNKKKDQ